MKLTVPWRMLRYYLNHPPGRIDRLSTLRRMLRRRLGDAARQKIQGAHSWDAYGASVLQIIDARSQQLAQRGLRRA